MGEMELSSTNAQGSRHARANLQSSESCVLRAASICKGTTQQLLQQLIRSAGWDPPPSLRLVHNNDWLLAQEYLHHKAWVIWSTQCHTEQVTQLQGTAIPANVLYSYACTGAARFGAQTNLHLYHKENKLTTAAPLLVPKDALLERSQAARSFQ